MAIADRLKEEIGLLKWIAIFGATFDVVGAVWLVPNYRDRSEVFSICAMVAVVILAGVVALAVRRMYRCFTLLEAA